MWRYTYLVNSLLTVNVPVRVDASSPRHMLHNVTYLLERVKGADVWNLRG